MYRITKDIKRFSTILILTGVVAISYGFFQSLTATSDDEIKYTVKKIANELDLKLKVKFENEKYNDVGYWMDENDEVIIKTGDKSKYEDGTKVVITEINTDGEGGYSFSTKKDKKVDYSELIYKVEKKLNCSIDSSHIHSVEDVIYSAKHYFHAKSQRVWSSLLTSTLFFLMISVAATLWWALQYVAQAGWSALLLRVPMAITSFVPYGAFILIFILVTGGMHWHHTFHWMAEGINDPLDPYYDEIIANKSAYLNIPFFMSRSFIYLLGWMFFAYLLKKYSLKKMFMEEVIV